MIYLQNFVGSMGLVIFVVLGVSAIGAGIDDHDVMSAAIGFLILSAAMAAFATWVF